MTQEETNKRQRGRPVTKNYPERIDASPEEIAERVLMMPPKKPGEWRYLKDKD
jgi:hypothetical protein